MYNCSLPSIGQDSRDTDEELLFSSEDKYSIYFIIKKIGRGWGEARRES
jgi:hypothetical protein